MKFFDAHNHLHDTRLAPFLEQILLDLQKLPLGGAVINGTSEKDWPTVKAVTTGRTWAVPSYGYHPWFVANASSVWREQLELQLDNPNSCIGEIGLDLWKAGGDIDSQQQFFVTQLEIAATLNRAASIHCLKAWDEMLGTLKRTTLPKCGFLLHSFGGPEGMIKPLIALGAYFSFPGYYLLERKTKARELFQKIPLDRVLIETDSPDHCLPPELDSYGLVDSNSGSRLNHPGNIVHVYEGFAKLKQMDLLELALQIEENFFKLFGSAIKAD